MKIHQVCDGIPFKNLEHMNFPCENIDVDYSICVMCCAMKIHQVYDGTHWVWVLKPPQNSGFKLIKQSVENYQ